VEAKEGDKKVKTVQKDQKDQKRKGKKKGEETNGGHRNIRFLPLPLLQTGLFMKQTRRRRRRRRIKRRRRRRRIRRQ